MSGYSMAGDAGMPPITCPGCGHGNPARSPFCNQCGRPLSSPSSAPQPPPGFSAPGGYPLPPPAIAKTNGSAIASLVLSLSGFVCLYLIGPILGIVFGYKARREIAQSGGYETGEGMATAGIIVGWILLALTVLGIVAIVAITLLGTTADSQINDVGYCFSNPDAFGC